MAGPNMQNHDYVMPDAEKTLVLFGKVGNGKSAVGNSILGRKEFVSVLSASGVTTTCKLGKSRLNDDEVVNVIDTPGIFNSSSGTENFVDEFFKCNTLAKDGIDGFILVCSIRSRFSIEEEGVLHFLKKIFGEKVMNYLILVFTGGDELETPIREYLDNCPSSFQTVLQLCGKRVVLFDNKTRDEYKRKTQVQQLMSLVKMVKFENGQSYKSDVILEIIEKKAPSSFEAFHALCEYKLAPDKGAKDAHYFCQTWLSFLQLRRSNYKKNLKRLKKKNLFIFNLYSMRLRKIGLFSLHKD
ncbi:hypothetical protein MKX03_013959 [Papaver bracteatum]|nr:hypothetical protein MKX03_013959 [Papaver bracteatum]